MSCLFWQGINSLTVLQILDSKVDDLLDLDDAELRRLLKPCGTNEVGSCAHLTFTSPLLTDQDFLTACLLYFTCLYKQSLMPDLRVPNDTIAAQNTFWTVRFSFQVRMPRWPMNWSANMLIPSCFRGHHDLLLCRLFLARLRQGTTTVPRSESYLSLSRCALQLAMPQVCLTL